MPVFYLSVRLYGESMCFLLLSIGGKGDVTLAADDENLLKLMTGQLNPQQVYFQLLLSY